MNCRALELSSMHYNSNGNACITIGMHSNNFSKSVGPNLHYRLAFLPSGRFPGKMNWPGQMYFVQAYLKTESITSTAELFNFTSIFHGDAL